MMRTVTAKNPEVQSFIRNLKAGDQVDIVYEEALAMSVGPNRTTAIGGVRQAAGGILRRRRHQTVHSR